jgi:hypothetical protein
MLRMIFPGIPTRTFVTSFFSGAYQERKVCGGAIAITHPKPPQFYLWFDICVCIRILRAVCL